MISGHGAGVAVNNRLKVASMASTAFGERLRVKNRWVVLAAGIATQTVLGGIYAWSTFTPWLESGYGLSKGQCGFIFGLTIAVFTLAMNVAGRVLTNKGPRFTASVGAVLFMCGYFSASFSNGNFWGLLLGLGVIAGTGIGFGYVCPLSVGMKWFPKKKGLVTGVAVAGFGGGAVILSSVAQYFLLEGMDILEFFRWFASLAGIILLFSASFLSDPTPRKKLPKPQSSEEVFTVPFAIITLGIFSGTFGGLLIVGNLTSFVLEAGFSKSMAVTAVGIFSIGNAVGRIAWGQIFDYFNYKSIPLSLTCFAIFSFCLLSPLPTWLLLLVIGLLGFCFGSNFVVYASAVSNIFGPESFPRLYPVCFLAYGLAGSVGPGIGGYLADYTGSYRLAIIISIGLVSITSLLAIIKLQAFKLKEMEINSNLNK